MATFEVTGPDGGRYQIDAPNEGAALAAFRRLSSGAAPDRTMGDAAKDVGFSFGSGLARGAAETAMLPVTIPRLMRQGMDAAVEVVDSKVRGVLGMPQLSEAEQVKRRSANTGNDHVGAALYSYQDDARRSMDNNLYAPQTTVGKYAKTVGEFVPGALLPGATVGNAVRFGVVPGIASEAAGQATEGTTAEPWARAGAGLAAGLGMAALQRPGSAQTAIESMAGGAIPRAELQAADALMAEAATRGIQLIPIEALNRVTNGKYQRLAQMQRLVENSEGGSTTMNAMMAQRPEQVQRAGQRIFDEIAPNPALPGQTGIAVRNAADATITDTQAAINAATRPAYQAAEAAKINPQDFTRLQSDPLFRQILGEIRGNPALNRTVANLPDDSVGAIDLVQRVFRERSQNAALPGQASTSNTMAANFESARAPAITAAEAATGGATGPYAVARQAQERLRGQYLEPLTEGQIGKLAATTDVGAQTRALCPSAPQAGAAQEVADTIKQLVRRDPKAATDLFGQHARTLFAETTQSNIPGANQFGGAKFAAQIRGNPEQAASLEAAIKALPGGEMRWKAFSQFLDVLEATGKRLPKGSETAFNQTMTQQLEGGAAIGRAATTGGVGAFKEIGKRWDQYQLSNKTEAIANLLTNSSAMGLFGRLAKENGVTTAAQALTVKLLAIAGQSARELEKPKSNPVPQVRQ